MEDPKTEKEILDLCDEICREMFDSFGIQVNANDSLYQEDLYFWFPTLKRTLSLARGYRTLINSRNYYAAIHLIRLVLDSGLRFASLWFVNDRQAFFNHINDNKEIRTFKDNEGKRLTDARLIERLEEYFPANQENADSPIKVLYEELCSVIHLNDSHIAMLKDLNQEPDFETKTQPFSIGSVGDVLTEKEKIHSANNMYGALVVVRNICKSWEQERASRSLTGELR